MHTKRIVHSDTCPVCGGALKEVMGDGENFEYDIVGYEAHEDEDCE